MTLGPRLSSIGALKSIVPFANENLILASTTAINDDHGWEDGYERSVVWIVCVVEWFDPTNVFPIAEHSFLKVCRSTLVWVWSDENDTRCATNKKIF